MGCRERRTIAAEFSASHRGAVFTPLSRPRAEALPRDPGPQASVRHHAVAQDDVDEQQDEQVDEQDEEDDDEQVEPNAISAKST